MRVAIPSILAGLFNFWAFPGISLWVASLVNDAGAFSVLSQDASQFVQNFLSIAGLLFSILVGQTCTCNALWRRSHYRWTEIALTLPPLPPLCVPLSLTRNQILIDYFLYTQQESIYYALFNEVTEAKSLLEQVALVCQGRAMYPRCLDSISRYVRVHKRLVATNC
jgi:hypothetical protein